MEDYWVCYARDACYGGRIKAQLEDFRVEEINPSGKVVTLTQNKGLPPASDFVKEFQEWNKQKKQGKQGSATAPAAPREAPKPLADIVGEDKARDIEAFAVKCTATTSTLTDELQLGVLERDTRVSLNRSLRHVHPSLAVRTDQGQVHIHVCSAHAACVAAFDAKFAHDIVDMAMGIHQRTDPAKHISAAYTTQDKDVKAQFNKAVGEKFGRLNVSAESGVVSLWVKTPRLPKKKAAGGEGVAQPYTHCVLQKTDLSWFEASRQLANKIRCHERDLSCAGMKDKLAVTTQRISVKGVMARVLAQFWHDKLKVSDITYETAPIATGDLAGNRFKLIVRDLHAPTSGADPRDTTVEPPAKRVKADDGTAAATPAWHAALRERIDAVFVNGFPNSFGPQRFSYLDRDGVHVGLHLVHKQYAEAVTAVMTPTEKDTDEVQAVKRAFLEDGDALKAAKALPPFKANERDLLFAKARAPDVPAKWFTAVAYPVRELWAHMLQSWVWNEVLWRRREKFGDRVLEGDLVMAPLSVEGKAGPATPTVCVDPSEHGIHEVVLPKPGGPESTRYPTHPEMAALYDEVLARHRLPRYGWDLKDIGVRLTETYRHVAVRPADGQYSFTAPSTLEIGFSLPLSCYATVCLGAVLGQVVA